MLLALRGVRFGLATLSTQIRIINRNNLSTSHALRDQVRVRFAPSPTGKIHLGGLRTAFYNYLFAKKHNGVFLLRIEDTDQERLQKDSVQNIIESLAWAGIRPDYGPEGADLDQGGPWYQSARLDLYKQYSEMLLKEKKAYRCFCDETRLSLLRRNAARNQEKSRYDGKCRSLDQETVEKNLRAGRPSVVRFKLDDKEVSYTDMIYGMHTSNPGSQEGDFIIIKSDQYPTYHFANVVDDHLMRITHVLRGHEWQLSTAKHLSLYEAFGWKAPVYGHLPLMCNSDGSKISKRQNDINILSFRERGYLAETLLAYLSSIGGGLTASIFEENAFIQDFKDVKSQILAHFDETTINTRPCKLNPELVDHLNKRFIRMVLKLGDETAEKKSLIDDLRQRLVSKYGQQGLNERYLTSQYLRSVLEWSQDRISKLADLTESDDFKFLWEDMSSGELGSDVNKQSLSALIDLLMGYFQKLESSQMTSLKKDLTQLFKTLGKDTSPQVQGAPKPLNTWEQVRLILIGSPKGPPVVEIIQLLGAENVLYRLGVAKKLCKSYKCI